MRILVIGAGPIGGIVGGRLARHGDDVTLVDVDPEHVRAMRERGLQIDVPDGAFTVFPRVSFPDELDGKFAVALIAVRSYSTEEVLASIDPRLADDAILVSLQNGINPPLLEAAVGPDRAIGTVVRMGSRKLGPGHLMSEQCGRLFIGHLHGKPTPQLQTVHALFDAVIPTEVTDNILGGLWSKLTYTCLGLFGSLADESLKNICADEANRRLCVNFFGEVVAVGKGAGVRFMPLAEYDPMTFHPDRPFAARLSALEALARNWKGDARTGPVRQLKGGIRTEVDFTLGHVVREGARLSVATPICRAVLDMIHAIEQRKKSLGSLNYVVVAQAG